MYEYYRLKHFTKYKKSVHYHLLAYTHVHSKDTHTRYNAVQRAYMKKVSGENYKAKDFIVPCVCASPKPSIRELPSSLGLPFNDHISGSDKNYI